jgi:ATP-dependent Clp protease ATP-binding subunit ClpB
MTLNPKTSKSKTNRGERMAVRTLDLNRRSHKAQTLASRFSLRIVGQSDATDALSSTLEKFQSGFYDKSKPIASLLFLGPTGTGKTGVAEAFAEGLFGSPTHMLKVDCAEFQIAHEIAKLVGSPPGYLGHRETHPFFTNQALKVLQTDVLPFTIILFDEIEKASDALWTLLLGILDKGSLTTGTNEKVDLTQTIIIMTSNVGSSELSDENAIGFDAGTKQHTDAQMKEIAMAAARRKFMPEFLNRLDHIVMFKSLTRIDIDSILSLELDKLWDRVATQSAIPFDFNVSPAGLRQLVNEGYDRRYNARNLKRTLERHVALPLGRLVTTGQVMPNNTVVIDYQDGKWNYYAQDTVARAASGSDIL